jgi:hypothetical protein
MLIVPAELAAGSCTRVPPVKSMPRLKPRNTIDTRQTSRIRPNTRYQRLRLPTMSNAPLPT